jgi:hypothetical protein
MARQVNHLSDIPEYAEVRFKVRWPRLQRGRLELGTRCGERAARSRETVKKQGRIKSYRVVSYEDVRITKGRHGPVDDRRKKGFCSLHATMRNMEISQSLRTRFCLRTLIGSAYVIPGSTAGACGRTGNRSQPTLQQARTRHICF